MTASRPARAMRGAAVVVALAIAWRIPVIEREFAAALTAADGRTPAMRSRRASAVPPSPQVAALTMLPRWEQRRPLARSDNSAVSTGVASRPAVHAAGGRLPSPIAMAQIDDPRRERHARDGVHPGFEPLTSDPGLRVEASTDRMAAATPASTTAFDLATAAYARLAAGDRRSAVRLFDAALAVDPRNAPWRTQRDALTRRWSASAYSIVRAGGSPDAAITPVLGGGQTGGGIAYTLDPLAARPLAVTLRGSIAHDDGGRTAFAAVGVQWRPLPGITVAAERLIGLGPAARDEWTARVAVGSDRRFRRLRLTSYAEGGIIGTAGYVAGQTRIGPEVHAGGVAVVPGIGGWASLQRDHGATVDRLDLGPGIAARAGPLAAAFDYRIRVAGNAAPGSGPVLTLSAAF